jgi:hypothetical protein
MHALDGRLGRSRLSMAAVGLLVGSVVRVVVLGSNGGGFRLCALSGIRLLAIKAEKELRLSASCLLAWDPAHPVVELGCSCQGSEPRQFSGAGAHALVVVQVILINACDLDVASSAWAFLSLLTARLPGLALEPRGFLSLPSKARPSITPPLAARWWASLWVCWWAFRLLAHCTLGASPP